MRMIYHQRVMVTGFSSDKMLQDFPDNPVIPDKSDDPHLTMAFGAQQRVDLTI